LSAYSDASWGDCPDSRCSRSGGLIRLGNNTIKALSKRQPIATLNSMIAEVNAIITTVKEIEYFHGLIDELGISQSSSVNLYVDNKAAIYISKNPIGNDTKHLEIKIFYLRQLVKLKFINLIYVTTKNQHADIFTKLLTRKPHEEARAIIGLRLIQRHSLY
jgi:hypothetical protein